MVLVDSCVWIEAAKGQGRVDVKLALRSLLEENEACFCGPVKLEVLGAVRIERREKFTAQMDVVPYVPMDDSQWQAAVRLSWHLRGRGVTVPWNDILISSIAIKHNLRVYTVDSDFDAIARVGGLALYIPGYAGGFNPE